MFRAGRGGVVVVVEVGRLGWKGGWVGGVCMYACMGLFANGDVMGGRIRMDRFHVGFPW